MSVIPEQVKRMQPKKQGASATMVTVAQALDAAMAHHQNGRLTEAEVIYRRILEVDDRNADALHLLGVVAIQSGQKDLAVDRISKAIAINDTVPTYHSNLGVALKDLGRLEEALAAYDAAVRLAPDYADAQFNRGLLLQSLGRPGDALAAYAAAVLSNPDFAEARYKQGLTLLGLGRFDEALAAFDAVRAVKPDLAELHFYRGNTLLELGRAGEALAAYDDALRLLPDFVEAHTNRATSLTMLNRLQEARAAFDEALRIRPDFAEALSNRGALFEDLGQFEEALADYDAALRLDPQHVQAHHNRGNVLLGFGRLKDAVSAYDEVLRLVPDHPGAHHNRGFALLSLGKLAEGWPEYEWRWRVKNWPGGKPRHPSLPQWRGEPAAGRTLLLWAEQGLGDSIQFMRYLPAVAAMGWGGAIVEVPEPLLPLFAPMASSRIRIVALGDPLPPADVQCPFLSLPLAFGTVLDTIPNAVPYLEADPVRRAFWQSRVPADGVRIGIVWQGNPGYKDDRNRSIPLKHFAPLAAVEGVHLISLQKTYGLDQLFGLPAGMTVETLGRDYDAGSFADTAALLMALDGVVTVDTAVAHLAGALGRPVWMALSTVPDWRWMTGREDTPWYPTMRLIRQTAQGEWDGVFQRIAEDVAKQRPH